MNDLGPYQPNEIYCGKSEEMLAKLPDGCMPLTVTSPPYDNLRDYDGFSLDWHEIIRQLFRVTAEGGVVVWIVADETKDGGESLVSFEQAIYARDCGFKQETMIYHTPGTGAKGSNYYYWQSFEYMFIWVKGNKPRASNLIADKVNMFPGSLVNRGKKSADVGSRLGEYKVKKTGIRQNMWSIQSGNGHMGDETTHPAPFPEKLARDHILSWSNPGDLVLDPFMGSGTTAKMAYQNGRKYLGFDISQKYVDLARKRVSWANPPLLVVG